MKSMVLLLTATAFAITANISQAWQSFLDGSSLPQANGWTLDGNAGTIVDLGGGNSAIQQIDDTTDGYDEWYLVNTNQTSTLAARFRIDTYGGGPLNILQLTSANSGANASPALAVAVREGRFYLIRFVADNTGAPVEDSRLVDLGAVELGIFNEAYLYIESALDRVRLFWNGGLRYTGMETNAAYAWSGEAYAEFGASNFLPEQDRSGLSTVTFDWVGLGTATDLPVALPFIGWTAYVDGSTVPGAPWQAYTEPDAGVTTIIDFTDPFNGAANQALQINSGSGLNEYYVGPFFEDEVFGGARFRLTDFSATGKENLIAIVTVSDPLSPAPSITLVNGQLKLWSYAHHTEPFGQYPGVEITNIGPAVVGVWHTAYLYAHKDGRVRLWWDGNLIYDDMAPLVNSADGYFEWGSGSWQHDATNTVEFDWVAYGATTPLAALTTIPADGAVFHPATNDFRFAYASDDGVATSGISIIVNGIDRTGDLVISGNANNRQGVLAGLLSNQFYRVQLTIVEMDGETNSYTINFATFSQSNFMFEAEDWNFYGGQFIDNPVPTSMPAADSYFGQIGQEGVDHHDLSTDPGASMHEYRDFDPVGTERTGDFLRQKHIDAQIADPNVTDYNVGWVEVGEWLNYTRTFPAGNYNIYGRFAYGVIGSLFEASMDKVADRHVENQTLTPVGRFRGGPGKGWQVYDFVPLTDAQGNLRVVALSGEETLRVTAVSGGYNANYYMLVPAETPILQISRSGANVVVSWTAPGFNLESAPAVTGLWTRVSNAMSPLTVNPNEPSRFYRLAKPGPPPPPRDSVVTFEDRADGALDGAYADLDWGTGVWAIGGPFAGIGSKNIYMNSTPDPTTSRISAGPGGAFLLKKLTATADSAWTISLADSNGQTFTQNLSANTPATITTGWTTPSEWVDITASVGYNAVIDDITYSR